MQYCSTKRLVVIKLGGSVLQTTADFSNISQIIKQYLQNYYQVAIAVSALKGTTDQLLQQAYNLSANPIKRELDMLASVGERISASLLCIALDQLNIKAKSFTGSQAGILTCEEHTQARIVDVKPARLHEAFQSHQVIVVAGFQGVSSLNKEITTLGRGGSDTSAVALGLALRANRVIFFKDVGMIFDSDPHLNPLAQSIEYCSYQKAFEINQSKKFILHPRAIHLAEANCIPLHIISIKNPLKTGTLISHNRELLDKIDLKEAPIYEVVKSKL
jgi:aspartate kinase